MTFKHFISENKQITFDETSTGMSKYDDVLSKPNFTTNVGWGPNGSIEGNYWREYKHWDWKIIHISPDAYIRACSKGFDISQSDVERTRNDLGRIKDLVDKGTKIHMPVLDYGQYFNQEGLHRALYAKSVGMKTIPVLVFISNTRIIKLDDVIKSIK